MVVIYVIITLSFRFPHPYRQTNLVVSNLASARVMYLIGVFGIAF